LYLVSTGSPIIAALEDLSGDTSYYPGSGLAPSCLATSSKYDFLSDVPTLPSKRWLLEPLKPPSLTVL
jgi:hypothetical protein